MPKLRTKYLVYSFFTLAGMAWLGTFKFMVVILAFLLLSRVLRAILRFCGAVLMAIWQILLCKGQAWDFLMNKRIL